MIDIYGALFSPVMQYSEGNKEVKLLVDDSLCLWFVSVNEKTIQCLGCQHGLSMFDKCVDRIREERIMN